MSHHCKILAISCMDFRLTTSEFAFLQDEAGEYNYDLIKIPGGVLQLVNPKHPEHREFILNAIRVSLDLHRAVRVILINHEDCGAYGGKKAFSSDEAEKAKHLDDLQAAKKLILENFGESIEVVKIYAQMEDTEGKGWKFEKVAK